MADKQDKSQTQATPLQATVAGSIAGMAARFCIAPLDVVKIGMQLQTHRLHGIRPGGKGIMYQCSEIYKEFGIPGFWRGNVPAEYLYLLYGGSQFLAYRMMNQALTNTDLLFEARNFIAGATAGAAGIIATYPFDLLRTRFAAQSKNKVYTSVFDAFRITIKTEGFSGLYTGLTPAVIQTVPQMGLFFVGYEALRPVFRELNLPFSSEDVLAGGIASVAAKTAIFPLDLIRKRLQVQGPARSKLAYGAVPEYKRSMFAAGRSIIRNEGFRGLYKGLTMGLIKASPTSALSVWFFERTLNILVQNGIFD